MWDQITEPADPGHVETVVELALDVRPRCGDTTVVAIDGRSGAGKTTLALGVAADLRSYGTMAIVHMDHLYPGWDGLAESSDLLATRILEPISRASTAAYARWDWKAGGWGGTTALEPTDFLVIDGSGSSVGPARPYTAVGVFVDADPMLRMSRGLARDGDTYRPHWQRWAAQEDTVFAADETRAHADLVIDTTGRGLRSAGWNQPT
jgi:para-aminobenzoate synthetase